MQIRAMAVGPIETNCYIVTDEKAMTCAIIDPGDEATRILDYLEKFKLTCNHILLTHAHFDHVGAVIDLLEELPEAKLYMSEEDNGKAIGSEMWAFKAPEGTIFIKDGDIVEVSALRLQVVATPGHTPGSVCFVCEDAIFSGDTLFKGSCGRTDFLLSDTQQIMKSLFRLAQLPGDYEIFPGHMGSTTMEREKRHNYFMVMACDR